MSIAKVELKVDRLQLLTDNVVVVIIVVVVVVHLWERFECGEC
jgi:hypothetical protein